MKLEFLGTGACFNPSFHNTSAYFTYRDNLVLLDCGETVYERLLARMDIDRFKQIYIFITHLHADHVGSLGSMLSYCACILKRRIVLIHPEKTLCSLLDLMGIDHSFYEYYPEIEDKLEGLRVKAYAVEHAADMRCYGYAIYCEGSAIYYSGDAANIPDEVLDAFLQGEITDLYQDTSTHNSFPAFHLYYGKLEEMIPKEKRAGIHCMHLDCDCRESLRDKGFSIAGE